VQKKAILAEVFTETHRVRGQLFPAATGLYNHLNRSTESFIEMEECEINPLHLIAQPGEKFARMYLLKDEIIAVMVRSKGELAAPTVVRAGYTKPFPHWVRAFLSSYELVGQIQTSGRFDFAAFMLEGDVRFMPMYDGTLNAHLFPRVRSQATALVFNRNRLSMLTLTTREYAEQEA
jgi:hypothetical protein